MFNIKEKYSEILQKNENNPKVILVGNKNKVDREIFILGAFCNLLEKAGKNYPVYAESMKPPDPDFFTFDANRKKLKQIEIVENLHLGRRRGDERKKPFDEKYYNLESYWTSFIKNLNKKFTKIYGKDSWLIMYHNIPSQHLYGYWINIFCVNKDDISERKIVDFDKSPYENIFVIDCSFNDLISIYPRNEVIFSKDAPNFIF